MKRVDVFERELIVSVVQAPSYVAVLSAGRTVITLPEGFELVHYTLRRTSDGHTQSYQPLGVQPLSTGPLTAAHTNTQDVSPDNDGDRLTLDSITPPASTASNSHQQLLNLAIRGPRKRLTVPDTDSGTVSKKTQKRHEESADNGYTVACGIVCPELAPPVKKFHAKGGSFHCPRCGSNYTRIKSVKDHFPGCVAKYGNPRGLRYTDDESMSSENLNADVEQDEATTSADDEEIKTEYVYGAE